MSAARAPVVAVIGGAMCSAREAELARTLGALLAARGAVLVCGGRGGVMEAACRGAQQAGGLTVGLLPGEHAEEGNPYLSLALPTGLGAARNVLVVLAAQAVIAIGGGAGTLSEIALALKSGRPVIGLQTWRASDAAGAPAAIRMAHNPAEAVRLALDAGG